MLQDMTPYELAEAIQEDLSKVTLILNYARRRDVASLMFTSCADLEGKHSCKTPLATLLSNIDEASDLIAENLQAMKQYAVIHAVAGLFEGYSDTTCEFFPKRGFAEKHIKQILDDYRKDEMCVNIDVKGRFVRPIRTSPSHPNTRTTTLVSLLTWTTTTTLPTTATT